MQNKWQHRNQCYNAFIRDKSTDNRAVLTTACKVFKSGCYKSKRDLYTSKIPQSRALWSIVNKECASKQKALQFEKAHDFLVWSNNPFNLAKPQPLCIPPKTCSHKSVLFDSELNFNHHIELVVTKLHRLIFLIKRLRKFLSRRGMLILVKTKIIPVVQCGITVWSNTSKYRTAKVKTAYNRCLRTACNLTRNQSITQWCTKNEMPTYESVVTHAHLISVASAVRNKKHPAHTIKTWFDDKSDTRKPKRFRHTMKKDAFHISPIHLSIHQHGLVEQVTIRH